MVSVRGGGVHSVGGRGTVLVVDGDPAEREELSGALAAGGFTVREAATGSDAAAQVAADRPDVVVLDLALPDVCGLDLLVDLTRTSPVPVIVVSDRTSESDLVIGLELGADDYVTKPFSARELAARVSAVVRRNRLQGASALRFTSIDIDELTHDVMVEGRAVELTAREFDLLVFLARSPRRVFSRAQILAAVWGSSPEWQDDSTVAEHIHRIRRKLDPSNRTRWIQTVRGVGYRFVADAG